MLYEFQKLTDKKFGIEAKPISLEFLIVVMSFVNSIALDYLARFLMNINVNKTYFMRLPFIQPTDFSSVAMQNLVRNSIRLLRYHRDNIDEDLQEAGLELPGAIESDKEYDFVSAENDIIIVQLYGLSSAEFILC